MASLGEIWGGRIREAREVAGLRQIDLAERCGIPQQTISSWETGSALPRDEVKRLVARALEVDPNVLFAFPDDDEPNDREGAAA
jgi:transcriptional regulator with XRE-family HTH domain